MHGNAQDDLLVNVYLRDRNIRVIVKTMGNRYETGMGESCKMDGLP